MEKNYPRMLLLEKCFQKEKLLFLLHNNTNSISYQISEMRSVTGIRQKIRQLLSVPDSAAALTAVPTIEYMELDNVSFRHEEKVILSHANYRFEAGRKYLILGENGSGKSTLFKLLTGLETEYEGCISVNGTDIRQLWPALYDQIGVVLQDAFIFDDTFLRNVTLYRPALRERAVSAMHSLGMDAFLASHDLDQVFQNNEGKSVRWRAAKAGAGPGADRE